MILCYFSSRWVLANLLFSSKLCHLFMVFLIIMCCWINTCVKTQIRQGSILCYLFMGFLIITCCWISTYVKTQIRQGHDWLEWTFDMSCKRATGLTRSKISSMQTSLKTATPLSTPPSIYLLSTHIQTRFNSNFITPQKFKLLFYNAITLKFSTHIQMHNIIQNSSSW